GLGHAHRVVVVDDALRAQIAQGEHRARAVAAGPLEQGQGRLGQGREAIGRNVVRDPEGLARKTVEEVAGNGLARRETDRMNQAVELVPVFAQPGDGRGDLFVVCDVAREYEFAVEFVREFRDAVPEAVADVGE